MKRAIAVFGIFLMSSLFASADSTKKDPPSNTSSERPPAGGPPVNKKVPVADMTAKTISVDWSTKVLTFIELPAKLSPGESGRSQSERAGELNPSNQTLPCVGSAIDALARMRGGETVRLTIGDMKGEQGAMEARKVITKIRFLSGPK